jgi:VWFA-related protein
MTRVFDRGETRDRLDFRTTILPQANVSPMRKLVACPSGFAALLTTLLLLLTPLLLAQDKIQASGEEVLVDVVVRDKNGKPITNLPQTAFTILDDGQPRPITAFHLIQGSTTAPAAQTNTPTKLDPTRQIRLITLVFDRMDQTERQLARQGALDLLKNDIPPNVYLAVFTLGNELQAIQNFTNRRDLLETAVNRATSAPSASFAHDSDNIRANLEQLLGPNLSGAQSNVARFDQLPQDPRQVLMARVLLDMLSFTQRSEMIATGRSTIWALLAGVRAQSQLPGRKAFVYFSEGFAIPQGAEEAFQSVISSANRSNVSFYPVDAHGLNNTRQNVAGSDSLENAAQAAGDRISSYGAPIKAIAQSADTAIEAGRLNTQDTLALLADETGGFLTANTNDVRAPLRRMLEELNNYYEITYTPKIEKYDGRFHTIGVKLDRADLRVQSRAGYFALPPEMLKGSGLNAYEVPLLKALTNMSPNRALPFESGGLHFHGDGRLQTCGFLIDMPLSTLTLNAQNKGGLAYVALIRDVKGAVIKKLQGEMPVELTLDQVLSFRQGRFTDMEYFDVPAGYYTIDVAVLDRESGLTGTRRNALFVPKLTDSLALSSVSLIRKWRPKEPDAAPDDPFVVGDKTVTPTLVPRINKSVSTSLPFYLIVYPDAANPAKPEIAMEFTRDGSNVKRVPATKLDAPDSQGRIQYLANAPIDQFSPGNYAVRFIVTQGSEKAEESFAINLEP